MEWTGEQQITFLLESFCLGIMQGFLFDAISGLGRGQRKSLRAILDVVLGPLAALNTFFGALIIMDGQLHPLLLTGCGCGMLVEHLLLGNLVSSGVAFLCKVPRYFFRWCLSGCGFVALLLRHLATILFFRIQKTRKKPKKQ